MAVYFESFPKMKAQSPIIHRAGHLNGKVTKLERQSLPSINLRWSFLITLTIMSLHAASRQICFRVFPGTELVLASL